MLRLLVMIPAILLVIYLAVVLLVWALQSKLVYPASQEVYDPQPGYREVTLETEDGLSLRAFAREAENGRPTIVYFHGNGGTLAGSMAANMPFAEGGYGLLLVNYRGYGSNPGAPSEEGLYRDGRAAMAWLAKQGIAPSEVILAANSIGSGTAVQMASEFPVRALVLTAPFTSAQDVAAEGMPWLPVRLLMRDKYDNAAKIGALDIPILVQHGTADRDVPVSHGKALAELARNTELQLFEGAAHDLVWKPESQAARFVWVERLDDQ